MKNYIITVNGVAYDVTVEENGTGISQAAQSAPVVPVAKPAAKPAATVSNGSVKITAPMPGKILSVKANAGANVKKGDIVLILEAMKMENEIGAPQDGTIAGINVSAGQEVEAGAVLATMN